MLPVILLTSSQEISQQQMPSPDSSSLSSSVEQTSETGSASQSESTSSTSLSSANTPSPGLARSSSPSASAAFSASTSFPVSSVSSSQTAEGPNGQSPDLPTSKGPEDRSEWSAGSIAGMVLGILCVIAIFLAFWRWLCRKRRRNVNADTFASAPPTYDSQAPGERNMPRLFGNAQHGIMPGQGHTGTSVLTEKEYYFRPYVVNPSPPSEGSTPSYRPRAVSEPRGEKGVVQWQREVAQNASGDSYVDESKSDIFIGSQSIIWSERSLPSTVTIDPKSQRLEEEEEYRGEEQQEPETRAQSTRANSVDLAWVFAEDAHKSAPTWAPPRRRPSVRSKHSTATRSTGRRPSIARQSIMSGRSGSTAAYTYRSGSSMPSVSLTRASSRLLPKVPMASPASQGDL